MLKKYGLLWLTVFALVSCSQDEDYTPVEQPEQTQISPVIFNLEAVPYQNLSDYNFFEGDMASLEPVYGVLPYDLINPLFSDFAKKKRFIWMPSSVKGSYTGDHNVINFPVGTVLIKNFYFENVQPENNTRVLETRLMIRKNEGWIFANYIWNEQQTEAVLNLDGAYAPLEWMEDGELKSVNYRIPAGPECHTCHKTGEVPIPIGPKPRNINKLYTYHDGNMNQLEKWVDFGYLNNNLPINIETMVAWDDTSSSIDERVRSYLDVNCAHCHSEESHCAYRPIRLNYEATTDPVNLGICVVPDNDLGVGLTHIVSPSNILRSVLFYRVNSTDEAVRMPLLGRTLKHDAGIDLIEEWINSLETTCN